MAEISGLSEFRKIISLERKNSLESQAPGIHDIVCETYDPLKSANTKLTSHALSYDSRRMINDLAGFQGNIDGAGEMSKGLVSIFF